MHNIRRAKAADAKAIEKLYSELNTLSEPCVSPERIGALTNSDHTYLLVCDDGEDILATALVCLCQDAMFDTQPFAIVENFVVSANYKRKGIGKIMMNYIENLCAQQNCSKIMLQTSSENRNAQDFYTALGFDPNAKVGFIKYRRYFFQ